MKRIIVILAALLLSISAFAQNGKSIYQKYSDADGVTAVYISPAMFRLIGSIPDLEVGEDKVNVSALIQALSGFYVLSSENPDINGKLRTEVERFINNGKYEMLMEVKESGETVRMYTMGNERTVEGFVMLAAEAAEVTFICLDGSMPRKDFEALIAKAVKS
jgi:hypothetical protein